jgi:hypothetical protein
MYNRILKLSLLEERQLMTSTHVKAVSIVTRHDRPKLSKGQKAFNTLTKQIENQRARLRGTRRSSRPCIFESGDS